MKLKLKAENANEQRVLVYLEENASDVLAEKINVGIKTLKGFFAYARGEAQKLAINGCACIDDQTVFGWAVHYFEEEEIKEPAMPQEPKSVIKATEVTKKTEKQKSVEVKKKAAKKSTDSQMSFFDMSFGGAI